MRRAKWAEEYDVDGMKNKDLNDQTSGDDNHDETNQVVEGRLVRAVQNVIAKVVRLPGDHQSPQSMPSVVHAEVQEAG